MKHFAFIYLTGPREDDLWTDEGKLPPRMFRFILQPAHVNFLPGSLLIWPRRCLLNISLDSFFTLICMCVAHNEPSRAFSLSPCLWSSWPVSICLHQSYQLTWGLDSSMPATPGPSYITPSFHRPLVPSPPSSAMQCCYYTFEMFNLNNRTALLSTARNHAVDVHKEKALSTFLPLNLRCQKYYCRATYCYPPV